MNDREKVIKGLQSHADGCGYRSHHCDAMECPYRYGDESCDIEEMCRDALELLKEQEEWEQALCKEICDFIRHGLNAIKADQRDYICHVIQQLFVHFNKSAHIKDADWFCADGDRTV